MLQMFKKKNHEEKTNFSFIFFLGGGSIEQEVLDKKLCAPRRGRKTNTKLFFFLSFRIF